MSFCRLASHPFSLEIFSLTCPICAQRPWLACIPCPLHKLCRRATARLVDHTVSEGSASITNFCCFRSCSTSQNSMHEWQMKSLMFERQDTLKVIFILAYRVISQEVLAQISSATFSPIPDQIREVCQNIDRWVSRVLWF